jgi:ribosomal protein S18 acetylase RimI-like enzyme
VGSPYIRPFEPRDREAVADICVRTAQHGEDARGHLASPELYAEIWALPYVDLAPELAFVLDAGDGSHRAIGYVLGVEDTASFRERAEREWFPAARARHPRRPAEDPRDLWLLEILHGEPEPVPPWLEPFPAHLHVDLLPEAQGGGWGRRLLETLFEALRERGVPGVHLGASDKNERAISFYEHLGMTRARTMPGVVYLTLEL